MPSLVVKNGPNKGVLYEITEEALSLGRDDGEAVQIFDQGVSRHHAEIFRIGEMFFIRDLGSRNGTFVNEEQITEELLRVGDKVRIGSTEMVFEDAAAPSSRMPKKAVQFAAGDATDAHTIEFKLTDAIEAEDAEDPMLQVPEDRTRDARGLKVLFNVARTLGAEGNMDKLLGKIVRLAAEAVSADHGYIFLRGGGKDLQMAASYEKTEQETPTVSRAIIKRVLQFNRAILTTDATLDERFARSQSVMMKMIRSVLCAPVMALDQLQGVMYLASQKAAGTFTSDDLELITTISIQAGVACQSLLASKQREEQVVGALKTLVRAVEMRASTPAGAAERAATYAAAIAGALKLPPDQVRGVQVATLLSDLGLVALSDEVLLQGSAADLATMQADKVEELLESLPGTKELLPAIQYHKEQYDGQGKPAGLSGEEIPQLARIIAAAKRFDQLLTSGGEEGDEMSTKEALMAIDTLAGAALDPKCIKALGIAHRTGTLFAPELLLEGL